MLPAIYDFWYQAFERGDSWAITCRFLNLFQYITFRAASAGLLAFILSVIFGPRVIRRLISLKVGQPIRTAAEVHKLAELHGGKIGTPTMGGVLIIGSVLTRPPPTFAPAPSPLRATSLSSPWGKVPKASPRARKTRLIFPTSTRQPSG